MREVSRIWFFAAGLLWAVLAAGCEEVVITHKGAGGANGAQSPSEGWPAAPKSLAIRIDQARQASGHTGEDGYLQLSVSLSNVTVRPIAV